MTKTNVMMLNKNVTKLTGGHQSEAAWQKVSTRPWHDMSPIENDDTTKI